MVYLLVTINKWLIYCGHKKARKKVICALAICPRCLLLNLCLQIAQHAVCVMCLQQVHEGQGEELGGV